MARKMLTLCIYISEEETKPLKIGAVDFCIETNTEAHNCENFVITEPHEFEGAPRDPQLVVRRGQPFKVRLTFTARNFNEDTDVIKLLFTICKYMLYSINEDPKIVLNETTPQSISPLGQSML